MMQVRHPDPCYLKQRNQNPQAKEEIARGLDREGCREVQAAATCQSGEGAVLLHDEVRDRPMESGQQETHYEPQEFDLHVFRIGLCEERVYPANLLVWRETEEMTGIPRCARNDKAGGGPPS